ncbi:hypothetical protein PPL_02777 [Heterostelium album PN500]|uniref:WD40 repeat-containing protein n=1 Tax=Heterostelium pallidum (strain ATCC 26659 / Pp 5 / PN500) TaxID=670386 RepID=D3B312_HETP5|nr:hypothetical protein PPL_02777 [Heterostelium album PN500]EFA83710.1 hypothetical protein PPL_02777 [Heterostelium album PN500]|eukprot:XP_020435827.1 hypothetical protein PPL_02777 [Heterostelium album PN500]
MNSSSSFSGGSMGSGIGAGGTGGSTNSNLTGGGMGGSTGYYNSGGYYGGGGGSGSMGSMGSIGNISVINATKPIRPSYKTPEGYYKLIKEITPQSHKYSKRFARSFIKLSLYHSSSSNNNNNNNNNNNKQQQQTTNNNKQKNIIPSKYSSEDKVYCSAVVGGTYFLYHFTNIDKAEYDESAAIPLERVPTCLKFNRYRSVNNKLNLVIGTESGEIFYIDHTDNPLIFNRNGRLVSSSVTSVEWLPGSATQFIACFASGLMLAFDITKAEITPGVAANNDDSHRVNLNPMIEWNVSSKSISSTCFSPNGKYLAVSALDGLLSVIDFERRQIVVQFKSYFGGFLCVDWSPDGKYLASGGEDDYLSIWSFEEKCLIARGQGHQSWVSSVKFDPFVVPEDESVHLQAHPDSPVLQSTPVGPSPFNYRIVTGGEDTRLLLWDFTRDSLKKPRGFVAKGSVAVTNQDDTSATLSASCQIQHQPNNNNNNSNSLVITPISRLQASFLTPIVSHRVHTDPVTDITLSKEWIITASNKKICIWARPNTVANTQKVDSMMCSPNTPSSFTAMNMKLHE